MGKHGPVLCLLLLLSACASTPDVTVQYYPAKSLTTFTTTQNIACTQDETKLVVTNTVAAGTEYSADTTKPPHSLHVKDLDNEFADASLSVDLFGDGRLKSINATSTGEGQAVISAAASLAGVMGPMLGASPGRGPRKLAVCGILKNWSEGKAALSFVKAVDLAQLAPGTSLQLNDDQAAVNDPGLYEQIGGTLPEITVEAAEKRPVSRPATYNASDPRDTIPLALHDISQVTADFYATGASGRHRLATKTFIVPGPGEYVLPIPKAALFGGEQFSLSLSESGAVTSLSYGKTSGAPAALGATTSAASVLTPPAQ